MSSSVAEHRAEAPSSLSLAVLTVSDTRTIETDKSGALIVELAEAAGHRETALVLYMRAISVYFMAQNCIYRDDDQEKIYLHGRVLNAFDGCMRTAPYDIERVEIPFENGETIQANFHRAPGDDPAPAVLFVPGMDMTKEGYPNCASNDFVNRSRGWRPPSACG